MTSQAFSRGMPRRRAARSLPFAGGEAGLALVRGRAHELCGPARRTLALIIAGAAQGPVLWIQPGWTAERLYPPGFAGHCDPGRLIFVDCIRREDLLWCAEEALRSGAVPVVVVELPAPPALTPVRRLHLAAEAGQAQSASPPLGLLLTAGGGGAQGVESRWHMAPCHRGDGSDWQLECRRVRGGMPATWRLVETAAGIGVAR